MRSRLAVAAWLVCCATAGLAAQPSPRPLQVFLDCDGCFQDYLRAEIEFVNYVRDRTEADVHLIITRTDTGGRGREYTAEFIAVSPGDSDTAATNVLKTVTSVSDSDDVIRRQIATMVRVGLLRRVTAAGVPPGLEVDVELDSSGAQGIAARDPWDNWVFSVRGAGSIQGEESRRELEGSGSVSADRITPAWKMTFGASLEERRERFTVSSGREVRVERRERDVSGLVVKGLGEHWSIGGRGEIESSTFDNTSVAATLAPALEFNVFPYSAYTRRQLRVQYGAGVQHSRYHEETLFGKLDETLPVHALSLNFEQTEQWGSLEASAEWSQYLHDLALSRLEVDSFLSWRLARGFSLTGGVSASRVRDQISLPRRGATAEEVLLELRELQSGYEYQFEFGLRYTFGSIFSAIVNPRFGQ